MTTVKPPVPGMKHSRGVWSRKVDEPLTAALPAFLLRWLVATHPGV